MKPESQSLKRSITWVQGVALTIGAVLGSGVLVLPVLAAEIAGPASLVSWLLMGLFAVPLVITLSRLASLYPDAGGIAAYAQRAFGPKLSAITGWLFLGTVPIGIPVSSLIGANYLGAYFGFGKLEIVLAAAVMMVLTIVFNYRGINLSGKVQLIVVAIIAAILTVTIISALPQVTSRAFIPFAPQGWLAVGSAMTVLFWAFVGWEMIGHLAEEFANPKRDIKLSLGISLAVINTLYILLALVVVGTQVYLGKNKAVALATLVSQSWGKPAGVIIAVLGFIVCYGANHTYVAGFSRLVYAQARQGDFPKFFAKLHPQFQTPHRVMLVLLPVFLILLFGAYLLNFNLGIFLQFVSALFIVIYMIGMASAIKLLKGGGRIAAMISLILCLMIYGFTGYAGLYPLILGAIGWFVGRQRSGFLSAES